MNLLISTKTSTTTSQFVRCTDQIHEHGAGISPQKSHASVYQACSLNVDLITIKRTLITPAHPLLAKNLPTDFIPGNSISATPLTNRKDDFSDLLPLGTVH